MGKGKWLTVPNPLRTYGLHDLGENFKTQDIIPSLVRESIQNSLDAKDETSDCVVIKFGYRRIDPYELPDALNLKRIFQYCLDFPSRSKSERNFFKKGLALLGDTQNKIGMLTISDYGTCGLCGAKTNAEGSRWKSLVMTTGAGNDDGSRGGGFGLGKDALYLASALRVVFFSTIERSDNYAAHMGVGCLATFRNPNFESENKQADRTIFYCSDNYNTKTMESPSIPGPIKFSDRQPNEYGTDIYIPGFEAATDKDELSAAILGEVLRSFIVAIENKTLLVVLPNDKEVSACNLGAMVDWYKNSAASKRDKDKALVEALYKLSTKPWKYSSLVRTGMDCPNFPEKALCYKFIRSDPEFNRCLVTREKGMVVHMLKDICGTTSVIGLVRIIDAELNAAFKKMENARHDRFETPTTRFPDKDERKRAKAQLDELRKCAEQWSEQEAGVAIADMTDAVLPDELDELFDICAGQFNIDGVKSRSSKTSGISDWKPRVKKHKRKNTKTTQAVPANITNEEEDDDANIESGVQTGNGHNQRKRGNPVNNRNRGNPNAPETNGFVLKALPDPVFYATGDAKSGRYKFLFRVPKSKAKVCACFSSTAENDGREALLVKSVHATSMGQPISAAPDLENTVVSFENVSQGQIIEAEVEFDVAHYCYAEVRYYEKKNI